MSLRSGFVLIAICLLLLPQAEVRTAAQINPRIELAVDTRIPNQDGLLTIYSKWRLGGDIGLPVSAGDLNGDGRADVVYGAMYASYTGTNNGIVNVYLSDGRDSGYIDARQDPPNILSIAGADRGDLLGTSSATGDVNGDGIRDLAMAAFGDDGPNNSRFNSGAIYLVYGARNFTAPLSLDAGNGALPPGVVAIYGAQESGRTGIWVDLGDIDGDGFADIVMGSDQFSTPGEEHRGAACIIFGSPNLPQIIDLANLPAGVRMSAILGVDREDHWGSMVHVGDINTDGIDDVAVAGAIYRDSASYITPEDQDSGHDQRAANYNGTRIGCGEVFVIYGSRNWPEVIDLSHPPANATHVIGAQSIDLLGSQMHSGDINGDGRRDFIVGALQAMSPERGRTGAVYILYGKPELVGATIDLALPPPAGIDLVTIYGEANLDCTGDSVRVYDINNDGAAELFIGSPEHTFTVGGEVRDDAGDTKFIFGRSEVLPSLIKLYDPPAGLRIFRLAGGRGADQGIDGGDEMSYRLTGADVDGDGYTDYIANAMHGDGLDLQVPNGGNVYVFSGRKLSAKLGMLQTNPPPALNSSVLSRNGQNLPQALAGQSGLRIVVTGTGFNASTEVLINGTLAVSRVPSDPQLAATQRIVELDENPAIRSTVGSLIVRTRNTNPPSALSNEVQAGTLLGPQVESIQPKRKKTGKFLLNIDGKNFASDATVSITTTAGQPVQTRSVSVDGSTFVKVVMKGSQVPPSGTTIRVRIVNSGNVFSNEVMVTVP